MEVHKVYMEIHNDNWTQKGQYLIAKDVKFFIAHQVVIIKDDATTKAIKQIINTNHINESFLAIEVKFKLQNSLPSK